MLWQRVLSALILIPILLAAIWFGDPGLSIVIAIAGLLGAIEFYRLANNAGWQPFAILGTVFVLLFILSPHCGYRQTTPFLVSSAVILPLVRLLWRPGGKDVITNWAWTIAGIFYIGWMLSHFILLRDLDDGRNWVLLALLATFAADSSAFLVGRTWGRRRLASHISPGKTWEGAVGGMFGGMAAVVILAYITGLDKIGYGWVIPLGFLLGIFAQLGDLAESMLKRNAGVKEAGKLIPGHGGILDRLDSIIFTVVLVYYYVTWITG